MRASRGCMLLLTGLGCLALTGCGLKKEKPWEPQSTALELKKDGTLTETIIDSLDQSWYNAQELESMINSSTADYDAEHGAGAVAVDSVSIENGQVKAVLTYKNGEDYASYNNVTFYAGSMLGAQMEGFLFYNEFRRVTDGQTSEDTITNEEPLSHKEYQVVVADTSHLIKVPGKIVYVSANARTRGELTAEPGTESGSVDEEELVLPSDAAYVEAQKDEVDAKDLEKTYMYIIYEF